MNPQVSVVMPIYKPDFLAKAIDSILAQTMLDFELILINDGSPYEAVENIARSYLDLDLRIRYIKQENRGLAGARNTGAAAAVGQFLMWMDDDDISLPERMQQQSIFLRAHPDIAAVNCAHIGIDGNDHINKHYNHGEPIPIWKETVIQRTAPPISDNQMVVIGAPSMVTKSAFLAVNGMRSFFSVAEDLDFYHRIEEMFPVACIPSVLYHYRSVNNPEQLTQSRNFFYYHYAAKISALYRRRGQVDPIDQQTNMDDLIKLFPLFPKEIQRNLIRQWYKSLMKNIRQEEYGTTMEKFSECERLFPADKKWIQKYKFKIIAKSILRKYTLWTQRLINP